MKLRLSCVRLKLNLVIGSLSTKICFLESFFTTSPGGAAATYNGAAATYMMDKRKIKLTQPS